MITFALTPKPVPDTVKVYCDPACHGLGVTFVMLGVGSVGSITTTQDADPT